VPAQAADAATHYADAEPQIQPCRVAVAALAIADIVIEDAAIEAVPPPLLLLPLWPLALRQTYAYYFTPLIFTPR